ESLDRLEILLAVVAKYPRPPGAAPFWLQIAHYQQLTHSPENALKTLKRAQGEAKSSGIQNLEALANFKLAKLEWSLLNHEKRMNSGERNKILALSAKALELISHAKDIEILWKIHHFRGSIFLYSGEQYPAKSEMTAAAEILAVILSNITDPGLRNIYISHPDREKTIDDLHPYISQIEIEHIKRLPSLDIQAKDLSQKQDQDNSVAQLQNMLDGLLDIQSSSNYSDLIHRFLQSLLQVVEADRAAIQFEKPLDIEQQVFIKTRYQTDTARDVSIPENWIRDAKLSGRQISLIRNPDETTDEMRHAVCAPLKHNNELWGVVYVDRPSQYGIFRENENELIKTMIKALSVALENVSMQKRLSELTEQFRKEVIPNFPEIIAQSEQMKEVFVAMQRVASADVPVLITGETGTGKDLIAKTIHEISNRKEKPFVYLDCSAIPLTLLEAELFGIEKGIATGVESRIGLLEYANGGTILLDEVAEIPISVQAKLLRVLQEREFEPVGSERLVSVDIRIISTTSRDLKHALHEKKMRDDFFYRISGVVIDIPPLYRRFGDIVLLARTFLQRYNAEFDKHVKGFTSNALDAMVSYRWPGNVRELQHVVKKAVLFCHGNQIGLAELGIPAANKNKFNLRDALEDFEQRTVDEMLDACSGDIGKTAELLGITQQRVKTLISKSKSTISGYSGKTI
ncbi:sigma-54-dependent Fis family transcriptional regulator, partial [bacterium]|nr:sigma-54-dependent Fis family transcriptional regulator [candidate division CSSED10-310 bacterium]